MTLLRNKIIEIVNNTPGILITKVSDQLDCTYPTCRYHVFNAVASGELRIIKEKNLVKLYPIGGKQ